MLLPGRMRFGQKVFLGVAGVVIAVSGVTDLVLQQVKVTEGIDRFVQDAPSKRVVSALDWNAYRRALYAEFAGKLSGVKAFFGRQALVRTIDDYTDQRFPSLYEAGERVVPDLDGDSKLGGVLPLHPLPGHVTRYRL